MKKLLLATFVLVVVAIACAPMLLSTSWGKGELEAMLRKNMGEDVHIEQLHLSWFGLQEIEGARIGALFACEKIEISAPLWQIILKKNLQQIDLIRPKITLNTSSLIKPRTPMKQASFVPAFELPLLPFSGKLSVREGELLLFQQKELLASYTSLEMTAELTTPVIWNLTGKTSEGAIAGHFQIVGKLAPQNFQIDTDLVNFPLQGIDLLLGYCDPALRGTLLEGVGPSLNLSLKAQLSQGTLSCKLLARSANLFAELETRGSDDLISLATPGTLAFTLTPSFAEKLLPSLQLAGPLKGVMKVGSFSLASKNELLDLPSLAFEAALTTQPANLQSGKKLGAASLKLSTPKLAQGILANLDLSLHDAKETCELSACSNLSILWNERVVNAPTTLSLKLSNLLGVEQGALELKAKTLVLPYKRPLDELKLEADFVADLVMDAVHVPPLKGTLAADTLKKLVLFLDFDLSSSKLKTGRLTVTAEGAVDLAKETVQAKTEIALESSGENAGNATGSIEAKRFFSENPDWHLLLDGQNLSLALLDNSLQQKELLTTLFGKELQFHLDAQKDKIALSALTSQVNIKGALTWKERALKLAGSSPLEIYYTLTDESFKRLGTLLAKNRPLFELTQPSVLSLTISGLDLPLKSSTNWKEISLLLEGGFDRFTFQEVGSKNLIKLDHLLAKIDKPQKESPLSYQLSSQIATKESRSGTLACEGKLIDTDDPNKLTLACNLDIAQFPTTILDLAAHLLKSRSLSPLFGETLDAKASIELEEGSGPIQFNVRSPNTRIELNGGVKEGVVTLLEPAHAQVLMNEELSRLLLKEVNPLGISSITSPHPFTLEVGSEGFALPLSDWKKLSLAHARIELGQILCRNEGALQITLGLLKSKDLVQDNQLNLWFAPIDFSIDKGLIELERSEILVSSTFEIATWGELDLLSETVDMKLGLTAQCLSKAFSIKNLPSDYVLQIPMRGKMDNVKVDTKIATAKIAALLLWQQQANAASGAGAGGGLAGMALGELLNRMTALPDKGASTPAAKHPFPWEKYKPNGKERKKESSSRDEPAKKSRIKKTDKPLKQLLKVLR